MKLPPCSSRPTRRHRCGCGWTPFARNLVAALTDRTTDTARASAVRELLPPGSPCGGCRGATASGAVVVGVG